MTTTPDTLYYYCASSTFQSLLEEPEIWLAELRGSNDRGEGNWAMECYLDCFHRREKEEFLKAKGVLEMLFASRTALGFCVSEASDLLSQWRGYADNGRGICIGFKAETLRKSARQSSMELHQVSYGDPTILVPDFNKKMHDCYTQSAIDASLGSDGNISIHSLLKEIEYSAIEELYCHKHTGFEEEKEWRVLAFSETLQNPEGISYRLGPHGFSPYIKLPFPTDAIESICLGPAHPSSLKRIEQMARSKGIQAAVRRSSTSYR